MYLCILCIMVAFKQPRVFYGKTNICGNCNIKQKYYMQGEGEEEVQIQIYGLTSPSFLSYFKYLEEKILFWKQPSQSYLRTLQKIGRIPVLPLLLFLASKFTKMNFYTVIFKNFSFFFFIYNLTTSYGFMAHWLLPLT